ncbi:MAG: hypothetical protein KME06_07065 [Kastovskya adunca ATA6-11-RM4]|nr:hypothetical protein [Kastovskya adunca ATA6-11-RM4]
MKDERGYRFSSSPSLLSNLRVLCVWCGLLKPSSPHPPLPPYSGLTDLELTDSPTQDSEK